jgi:uncharacterized phage protein gp47/JayE
MSLFNISDLTKELTPDEVETAIYQELDILGVETTVWKPGAVVRTLVSVFSVLLAYCTYIIAGIAQSGFLYYAQGGWLSLLAQYTYNLEREGASNATGNLTLTNSSATPYTLATDDLIVSNPDISKEFRNAEPVTIPANGSVTTVIVAVEEGSASSSPPHSITSLVTALAGVTCTNADAISGFDAESDDSLKKRCQQSTAALSPFGPSDAYRYAAVSAERDGQNCGVTRIRLDADGMGNIDVYCATSTGEVPGTVGDLTTDLGCVADAIQHNAVPLGITANVFSCTTLNVSVTYTVYVYDSVNLDPVSILALTDTALGDRIDRLPIGGDIITTPPGALYLDSIKSCIDNTLPEIYRVVVHTPTTDTPLTIGQVAVLASSTGSVVISPSPENNVI